MIWSNFIVLVFLFGYHAWSLAMRYHLKHDIMRTSESRIAQYLLYLLYNIVL